MSELKKSQVLMKTDTTEHWKLAEQKYIPAPFTIIVYQDEGRKPRLKISDGKTLLGELPFINMEGSLSNASVEEEVLQL